MTDENDNIPTFVEHTFSFEVYESAAKVPYCIFIINHKKTEGLDNCLMSCFNENS